MPAPVVPILIGIAVIGGAMLLGKKSSAAPPPKPAPGPGIVPLPAPPIGGVPGGGYTAPPLIPGSTPSWPPSWWPGKELGAPPPLPTPAAPGTGPIPGTTTGPTTAAPDDGIAGLPEPLKTTTLLAMSNAKGKEGADSLDGLALELDRIGQHKAAYQVRARSNELRSGTSVSGSNLGDPALQYPGYPPTGVFPAGYAPLYAEAYGSGEFGFGAAVSGGCPGADGGAQAAYDAAQVAAIAIPLTYAPQRSPSIPYGGATAFASHIHSGLPSLPGGPPRLKSVEESRAYQFGYRRGREDRSLDKSFWPGGAVAGSDLYKDGVKLGWPHDYILRIANVMRQGYGNGFAAADAEIRGSGWVS